MGLAGKNKKTALITGITGQDGAYLANFLLSKGYIVYGISRSNKSDLTNLNYFLITDKIKFNYGDITDERFVSKTISQILPDEVYNLAAQSFVGVSWEKARITTFVNSLGNLYLLQAIRDYSPNTRFYQASTCEIFGSNSINGVQNEMTPFDPKSPYAVSKVSAHYMTRNFRESYGLFCVNGILFNHESPLRGKEYVTRKITSSVAKIKLGLLDKVVLENLGARRDWGFSGDYVLAMWLMLQQKTPKDYTISTGELHSIEEVLEIAFTRAGIKSWGMYVSFDERFKRPLDVVHYPGDSTLAKKELGWTPKISFKEMIEQMVDYDIQLLEGN